MAYKSKYTGKQVDAGLDLAFNSQERIDTAIRNLVDGAPETLNTLKEVAEYIASDESHAADVLAQLANLAKNDADMSKKVINTVDITKLDTLTQTKLSALGKADYWLTNSRNLIVGRVFMFEDPMRHKVTQVVMSNMKFNENYPSEEHYAEGLTVCYRFYGHDVIDVPADEWTSWKMLYDSEDTSLAELAEELATKQQELTLTVLDNGNIRIGNLQGQTKDFMPATPSGDPMHYAYEVLGAVWNANSGFWEFGMTNNEGVWMGLKDLSNADMRKAYAANPSTTSLVPTLYQWSSCLTKPRFVFLNVLYFSTVGIDSLIARNNNLEYVDNRFAGMTVNKMADTFFNCPRLKVINIIITARAVSSFSRTFDGCTQLEYVRIKGVKSSISFKDSPSISNDSVLYIINESEATADITITLHANAYTRAMADASILTSLEAHPNVSLASA